MVVRLFILTMVISTVLYIVLSIYARAARRSALIEQWAADMRVGDREAWLREELAKYDQSFKRRLIWLVYVLPLGFLAFITTMLYVQNYM